MKKENIDASPNQNMKISLLYVFAVKEGIALPTVPVQW
jgi:hypothetical protein